LQCKFKKNDPQRASSARPIPKFSGIVKKNLLRYLLIEKKTTGKSIPNDNLMLED